MKKLDLPNSPYTPEVAKLVKDTRLSLKISEKNCKEQYSERAVCKKVGCSLNHYRRFEAGEKEICIIQHIYGISAALNIPMDKIVQMYLGISDSEILKHFTIVEEYHESYDNRYILKEARKQIGKTSFSKWTIRDIADISGVSPTYYNRTEIGEITFKDIRFIYSVANRLNIPMYVLIRNALGITDEDMKKVISIYRVEKESLSFEKVSNVAKQEKELTNPVAIVQNKTNIEFAQLIEEARKKSGRSQRIVAKELGISNSSWARWERGEIVPSNVNMIYMISKAVNLSFFDLLACLYPNIKEEYQKEFEIIQILNK